jgi:hypothetical protein
MLTDQIIVRISDLIWKQVSRSFRYKKYGDDHEKICCFFMFSLGMQTILTYNFVIPVSGEAAGPA